MPGTTSRGVLCGGSQLDVLSHLNLCRCFEVGLLFITEAAPLCAEVASDVEVLLEVCQRCLSHAKLLRKEVISEGGGEPLSEVW